MPRARLGDFIIDSNSRPYVIAEIGVNHEGSVTTAKEMIDAAKSGGADAAKFQTYKANTLAAQKSPSYWNLAEEPTTSQFELFKRHDSFGDEEYLELAHYCGAVGIDFLSTAFDAHAVELLAPLVPMFKIASADLTNIPLIRQVGAKGKPTVLSTGAARIDEIERAVKELEDAGAGDIVLLHCILNYPCDYENAHLNMIEGLAEQFPSHVIGYSDHTRPDPAMIVLTSAYLKGARVIEKHFTFDKGLPGNDHYHAMDVDDLRRFTENVALLSEVSGNRHKKPLETEDISRLNARRSIVAACAIKAGETIAEDMIIPKRPATGISPEDWDRIIGARAKADIDEDQILQWADLDQ
ncbi:MAG: acetylneuraminic acid synthetase [Magnetovibrio sp.]|nr:acetylneuraminic acid synthetase [Magnetovibrio sp.]